MLTFIILLLTLVIASLTFPLPLIYAQTDIPIVSTRNFFNVNTGERIPGINLPPALSILNSNACPGELGFYLHGWWASPEEAIEQTERVFLSLQKSDYDIPILGFSWNSHTGWDTSKKIANGNGPLLADFIKEFKDDCPTDDVRMIAHSLGSRVALSAIQSLYDTYSHETVSKILKSVHLLGAAVDNEQVSLDDLNECRFVNNPPLKCTGEAISLVADHFYSLFNPEDNLLAPQIIPYCTFCSCPFCTYFESTYYLNENDDPLGRNAVRHIISIPPNYEEYNVMDEIGLDDDADGDDECDLKLAGTCTIRYVGDNHFGYMGYRSVTDPNIITNSRVMNLVAGHWRSDIN
jgi:hypothetical protein